MITRSKKINFNKMMNIVFLQLMIVLYTISGIAAKKASGYMFLSSQFALYYSIEILILALYAILWQQLIKKFDISIAYSNRALSIFWSLLWAVMFFGETISLKNIIGAFIILIGVIVVNSND